MTGTSELAMRWRVRLGYPLAVLYFWLARPTVVSLEAGAAIAVAGLVIRGAAAGYLRKHEALATGGPYAFTRNPLYFGSALLASGLLVAGRSWVAALLLAGYFVMFYAAVMRREEQELRAKYGEEFEDYAARVPLFWPGFGARTSNSEGYSWSLYRRNREYQAALGFVGALVLLALKMFWWPW